MKKELKKREELESTVKVLQSSVAVFQKQVKELSRDQEELQQYDRRLLVRVDGIPLEEKETTEDVLTKDKSLITEMLFVRFILYIFVIFAPLPCSE